MDEFQKMDVFFVVATLGFIVLTVLASLFLFYAIRVAQALDRIAKDIEVEAHELKQDIDDARLAAKREGRHLLHLVDVALATGRRFVRGRKKTRAS
jgi:hypothetical protein